MTMMNDAPAMIQNYKVNTHKAREEKQKAVGGVMGIRGREKVEREKGKYTQS